MGRWVRFRRQLARIEVRLTRYYFSLFRGVLEDEARYRKSYCRHYPCRAETRTECEGSRVANKRLCIRHRAELAKERYRAQHVPKYFRL